VKTEDIKHIAVIGAGTMGHGIAQAFASRGYQVSLRDVSKEVLDGALNRIRLNLDMFIQKGLETRDKIDYTLSHIETTADVAEALHKADFAIEAASENLELKKNVFREMDRLSPKEAILATNTSSYRITDLASTTSRPDLVVGAHWMNPAHLLPLVEVVKGDKTSDETVKAAVGLMERLGKTAIVCKDVPGFLVNRMQAAMFNEAISLVEQGICSMEEADKVWTHHLGLRFALIGPMRAMDAAGLDTWHSIFQYLYQESKETKFKPSQMLKKAVDEGRLGFKKGKGFYDYAGKSVDAIVDERNEKIIWLLRAMGML
jgi:3-hydroxybutyryl-CoA dehydrogenase